MIPGIDVSRYERVTSWSAVKAKGYLFMATRATVGDYYIDPTFNAAIILDGKAYGWYWSGAKAAGLKRMAYHVIAPERPKEQINEFIDLIKDDIGELPPVIDVELVREQSRATITECVRHAIVEIETRLGVKPLIYTTQSFYSEFMNRNAVIEACPLWVANYTTKPTPAIPVGWSHWDIWQYSEAGVIPGIVGATDLNWMQDDFMPSAPTPPIPEQKPDREYLVEMWNEHHPEEVIK